VVEDDVEVDLVVVVLEPPEPLPLPLPPLSSPNVSYHSVLILLHLNNSRGATYLLDAAQKSW
jgi:hypothetical protein